MDYAVLRIASPAAELNNILQAMPVHDEDISWDVLRKIVRDWAGSGVELASVCPLEGGCINTTLSLITKCGRRAVLKISQHRVNRAFENEARQLVLLREVGIVVPEVFAQKTATLDDPHSYLLMEFIDGVDFSLAKRSCDREAFDALQCELADIVATLHDTTNDTYARISQTDGTSFDNWPAFYRSIYDPIVKRAQGVTNIPVKARKRMGKVHDRLESIIAHSDRPRLTHWDIWSTNLLARPDAQGRWHVAAMLDPNCRYAHAEAEIAYMELFHTVTPAFMKAYSKRHRIDEEYRRTRKWIYQLYPLIDHVVLFGDKYITPMIGALDKCPM